MFNYDITQGLRVNNPAIKNADKTQTPKTDIPSTNTAANNYEFSIEHDENSAPLTPEQIEAKQSAKQKALEDIEKAKRANKTIVETDETENGTYTIETKYDALGNEEKRIVKREDGSICSVDEFNNGVISKTQMFLPEGNIVGDIEYNKDGKPLREHSYSMDPNEAGKIENTVEYEYYENGNLKSKYNTGGLFKNEEYYYENGNPKYKRNINQYEEYNEKGQLIKSGLINHKTGNDRQTTLYEYDSMGRLVKESYSHAEGELGESGTREISYEENVAKSVVKNAEGQTTHIRTEETLADGSKKYCIYSPDGTLRTEQISSSDETKTSIYDKDGKIIGYSTSNDIEITDEDGGKYIDTKEKYYNSNGEEISEDEYYNLKSEKRDDFEY